MAHGWACQAVPGSGAPLRGIIKMLEMNEWI